MKTIRFFGLKIPYLLAVPGALLLLTAVGLVAYRVISNKPLGLRSWVNTQIYFASSYVKMAADQKNVTALNKGEYTNLIFLHHSVGDNIIDEGGLRDLLAEERIALSDQDYIGYGLSGPDGAYRGYTLPIPDDNTDPDGLANIFSQPELPLPLNAFSGLMQYEVVMMKSCFPANYISSDEQVELYKANYLTIRNRIDENPDKFFILLTIPPLNQAETNPEEARRARETANWLASPDYVEGRTNLAVFDLYDFLAGDDPSKPDYNVLKAEYATGSDSHPNERANRELAPLLAEFIRQAVENYRSTAQVEQ